MYDFKIFCALPERISRLKSSALDFATIQQPRVFVINENVIQCFADKVVNINHVKPRKPNEFTLHAILVSHSWGKQERRAVITVRFFLACLFHEACAGCKRHVVDQTFLQRDYFQPEAFHGWSLFLL